MRKSPMLATPFKGHRRVSPDAPLTKASHPNDTIAGPAGHSPALYRSLTSTPFDSDPLSALLTVNEASQLLKVSVSTIRRLLEQRTLPFIKVGGSIRFVADDLVSYLAKNRVEPIGP